MAYRRQVASFPAIPILLLDPSEKEIPTYCINQTGTIIDSINIMSFCDICSVFVIVCYQNGLNTAHWDILLNWQANKLLNLSHKGSFENWMHKRQCCLQSFVPYVAHVIYATVSSLSARLSCDFTESTSLPVSLSAHSDVTLQQRVCLHETADRWGSELPLCPCRGMVNSNCHLHTNSACQSYKIHQDTRSNITLRIADENLCPACRFLGEIYCLR